MNEIPRRRFGIADGWIVIAAVAAGMGLVRATNPYITPSQVWAHVFRPHADWSFWDACGVGLEIGATLVAPFVAAWTPACLWLQVKRPRPPWRRLRRSPGFVACLIATTVIFTALVAASTCEVFAIWSRASDYRLLKACLVGVLVAGAGVLSCWATMALCGAFRPRPTWTDRLGRLTGAAWIALGFVAAVFVFLAIP